MDDEEAQLDPDRKIKKGGLRVVFQGLYLPDRIYKR